MSSYIKDFNLKTYFCIDDFFGNHRYGYVELNEKELETPFAWSLLEFSSLEGRGGERKVLTEDDMFGNQ